MDKRKILKYFINGVLVVCCLPFVIVFLIGLRHFDLDTGTCPDAGPQFYESAVRERYVRGGKTIDDIEFLPGTRYAAPLYWYVPFKKGSDKYFALVDCRGGIELGRPTD
ncbi:hypothetical protein [Cupriavidus sp. YR651]|uniref:hypothetical protein n=1 Tax=Cupriavidus sp. YR651 TaxID=1855315 RepID=UPI00115FF3CD|nr:hypothetical protein [Cupriavidus sp. YR651]